MDKQPIRGRKTSRFKRFINGNGFYAALAACLLAVGGVAFAAFSPSRERGEQESRTSQPVEQVVTGQPDDRTTAPPPTTQTAPTTVPKTTQPQAAALYVLPLTNLVQQPFSPDAPLYSVTMGDWRTHEGTDFAGENGQKVKAVAEGKVTRIGTDPFWGKEIEVDHGVGVITLYRGVHPTVAVGETVKVGQPIGTLTEIPCESAQQPHLHLQMTVDGRAVDPVAAIGVEVRAQQNEEQ